MSDEISVSFGGTYQYDDDGIELTRLIENGEDVADALNSVINEALRTAERAGNSPPYEITYHGNSRTVTVRLTR